MTKSEIVKAARTTLGLSQKGLADRIDCSVYTISSWEQGRHEPTGPSLALLSRLVDEKKAEAALSTERAAA